MEKIKALLGPDRSPLFTNLEQIVMSPLVQVQEQLTIPEDVAKQIMLIASKEVLKGKFTIANELDSFERIITGCSNIDALLNGGVPINGICELYGPSGVGKTQFCLQVALTVQLPTFKGGKEKEVVYICTEQMFPSKRFRQLAKEFRHKHKVATNFEENVYIEHIGSSAQLQTCIVNKLPIFMKARNVGLVVIDSIAGSFSGETEKPNYISRSANFRNIIRSLCYLQEKFGCGILVVNQVRDNLLTGCLEPCLGLSWANNITNRFYLERPNRNEPLRTFSIIFAPDIGPGSCNILIEPQGLIEQ